ncbi:hypothetical protein RFI_08049 [Reticulomyxa filosa]|uniref:Uncharacterized protein n=1 Tax=Reticulomyxa filosa TaxID=46433 RepID=X6NSU4_RETFI|nr:hypothetical protein RFI_08049 [Reticulomyxa filosa]|eukprot:ETO29076.1 hypothetical protein RFI_08049 [Reticulomyxa filosa]
MERCNGKRKIRVNKCYEYIKQNIEPNCVAVLVYGELFGGNFGYERDSDTVNPPARDELRKEKREEFLRVVTSKKYKAVQIGVSYSPYHHFFPFDIRIVFTAPSTGTTITGSIPSSSTDPSKPVRRYGKRFLTFSQCLHIFEHAGQFDAFPKPLFKGTLQHLLDSVDVDHLVSTIPQQLKLPLQPTSGTIAEGVVLRRLLGSHVLLKFKCEAFAENCAMGAKNNKHRSDDQTAPKKKKLLSIGKPVMII